MAIRNIIAAASLAAMTFTGTSGLAALADDRAAVSSALQQEVNEINAELPGLLAIIRDGSVSAADREEAFAEYRALNSRKSSITYHLGVISTYSGSKLDRVINLYGLSLNLDDDVDVDPDPVFNVKEALLQRIDETTQQANGLLAQLRSGELEGDDFDDVYDAYRAARARVSSMTFHASVIDGYNQARVQLIAEFYNLGVSVS